MSSSLEPPVITSKPPSQVAVVQGSTLSLCCEATGSPSPQVQWSRADQYSDSTLAFQENGCLEINTVRYNSDGNYICRATNHFGLAETTTRVIVNMKGCVFFIMSFYKNKMDSFYIPLKSENAKKLRLITNMYSVEIPND